MSGIHFTPSALDDLQSIIDYYREQEAEDQGRAMVAGILSYVRQLKTWPESGRVVPEFATPDLRELIRPPFRVVYRREKESIFIVRVWRSERLMTPLDSK